MTQKLKKAQFDFDDFLESMKQMRNMGGLGSIMSMMPGLGAMGGRKVKVRMTNRRLRLKRIWPGWRL